MSEGSAASGPTARRLVPLEIGRLDDDLAALTGGTGRVLMPVPSWLIEHRHGVVLFDAGMDRRLQTDTTRVARIMPSALVSFHDGEALGDRISQVGYSPDDVRHVVVSHLHFDHVGGVADVPDARLVVQAAEWRAGHHPRLIEAGVYAPDEFDIGHQIATIEGEHDLFGDGSVVCVPTPGHTPGHQALRVRLPSRTVVLTADCIYFANMLDTMSTPRFAYDRELQLQSMRTLIELRSNGCELLFGHDLAQFRSLPPGGLR